MQCDPTSGATTRKYGPRRVNTADDGERGGWQAQRDLAARDWDRALGPAAALEELADVLGVALTEACRRHLPTQRR